MSGKLSDRMALGAVSLYKIWNRTAEWCETLCNCNCLGKCPTFFCTPDYAAMDKLWWKADWSTAVIFEAEYMKQASQSLEHLCVLISALEKHRDSITRIMPPYSSLDSQIGSDIVRVARTCLKIVRNREFVQSELDQMEAEYKISKTLEPCMASASSTSSPIDNVEYTSESIQSKTPLSHLSSDSCSETTQSDLTSVSDSDTFDGSRDFSLDTFDRENSLELQFSPFSYQGNVSQSDFPENSTALSPDYQLGDDEILTDCHEQKVTSPLSMSLTEVHADTQPTDFLPWSSNSEKTGYVNVESGLNQNSSGLHESSCIMPLSRPLNEFHATALPTDSLPWSSSNEKTESVEVKSESDSNQNSIEWHEARCLLPPSRPLNEIYATTLPTDSPPWLNSACIEENDSGQGSSILSRNSFDCHSDVGSVYGKVPSQCQSPKAELSDFLPFSEDKLSNLSMMKDRSCEWKSRHTSTHLPRKRRKKKKRFKCKCSAQKCNRKSCVKHFAHNLHKARYKGQMHSRSQIVDFSEVLDSQCAARTVSHNDIEHCYRAIHPIHESFLPPLLIC